MLTYMLDTATALSRIPHAFQTNTYLGAIDMALCYGSIVLFAILLHRKRASWYEVLDEKTHNK
jgi:hypothetical protein